MPTSLPDIATQLKVVRQHRQELIDLESQRDAIRRRIDVLDLESAAALAPYVYARYATWRPRVGDTAQSVSLLEGLYFDVTIIQVNGPYVDYKPKSPMNTATHGATLDRPAAKHQVAAFLMPTDLFESIREPLQLKDRFAIECQPEHLVDRG